MTVVEQADTLRIEVGGGVVKVWHGRSARNRAETNTVLGAIDRALEESEIGLLLFDSRDSDRTPAAVQDRIWQWLSRSTHVRKVATLLNSRELAADVRAMAVGHGVMFRAFHDEDEARHWLLAM
ncbi:MAG: hypothetical protein AAF799_45020 [Myxococcota bacterium]